MRRRSSNKLQLPREKRGVRHADIPYDQCTMCTKKHIVKAWSLFNGFHIHGRQPRRHDGVASPRRRPPDVRPPPETARLARDLAILLGENRDAEIGGRWEALLAVVRKDFNGEYTEVTIRRNLENNKPTE